MLIFNVISQLLACFPHRTLRGTLYLYNYSSSIFFIFYVLLTLCANGCHKNSRIFFIFCSLCTLSTKTWGGWHYLDIPIREKAGPSDLRGAIHSCSSYVPTARNLAAMPIVKPGGSGQ